MIIHFNAYLWPPAQPPPGLLLQPAWEGVGRAVQREDGCVELQRRLTARQGQMHGFLLVCLNSPPS